MNLSILLDNQVNVNHEEQKKLFLFLDDISPLLGVCVLRLRVVGQVQGGAGEHQRAGAAAAPPPVPLRHRLSGEDLQHRGEDSNVGVLRSGQTVLLGQCAQPAGNV